MAVVPAPHDKAGATLETRPEVCLSLLSLCACGRRADARTQAVTARAHLKAQGSLLWHTAGRQGCDLYLHPRPHKSINCGA